MNPAASCALPWRAAIIDLDGTLVDTLGDFCAALDRMLAALGHAPLARTDVETMIGKGSEHLIRSVLAKIGEAEEKYDEAWTAYQHAYREINGSASTLFTGAQEGLALLAAARLPLACLTNKPTEFAQELLLRKGIAGHFGLVFGGDAFERKKPHPLPILRTCEALGTLPAETLVIGDSSNDAQAARAAGCPVLLVTYGYNHGMPARHVDADGYLDSMAELASWLPARAARIA